MPNNSESTSKLDVKQLKAVKLLLTYQDVQMYLEELDEMYRGFITSEYADHQPTRHNVMVTYNCIKEFLVEIHGDDRLDIAV